MSLLTELGISLGAFLQICRAYGAEEKSRRQELIRAGHKIAPGIVFQRETRQAANQAAHIQLGDFTFRDADVLYSV
jgi:hypothetical protein